MRSSVEGSSKEFYGVNGRVDFSCNTTLSGAIHEAQDAQSDPCYSYCLRRNDVTPIDGTSMGVNDSEEKRDYRYDCPPVVQEVRAGSGNAFGNDQSEQSSSPPTALLPSSRAPIQTSTKIYKYNDCMNGGLNTFRGNEGAERESNWPMMRSDASRTSDNARVVSSVSSFVGQVTNRMNYNANNELPSQMIYQEHNRQTGDFTHLNQSQSENEPIQMNHGINYNTRSATNSDLIQAQSADLNSHTNYSGEYYQRQGREQCTTAIESISQGYQSFCFPSNQQTQFPII